jgi:hypothetical protein
MPGSSSEIRRVFRPQSLVSCGNSRVPAARTRLDTVRATFRAPMSFVLHWCTGSSPEALRLEGGSFRRRFLNRSRWHVVYEDLEDTPEG